MYGLKRIILIDSLFAGKQAPIVVDGHASLSGTNGAGKTSVEKLIPFFYGCEPAQLESQAAGKKSFMGWYLPRDTSLIVYEYERESGLACAVMSRHSSGLKPAYRFLSAGFSDDLFTKPGMNDRRVYLKGTDLAHHWREKGVEASNLVETIQDYRAIIQHDRHAGSRGSTRLDSEIKSLMNAYSLCGRDARMRHIEKVSLAILRRQGSMERIKTMLASIMEGNGVAFPKPPEHRYNQHIGAEVRTLRKLKGALEGAGITRAYDQYLMNEGVLGRLKYALTLRHDDLEAAREENTKSLSELADRKNQSEVDHQGRMSELSSELNGLSDRIERNRHAIETLEADYAAFEEEGVTQMKADLDSLERYHHEWIQGEERYQTLSSGNADLVTKKAQLREREMASFQRVLAKLKGLIDEKSREIAEALAAKNDEQQRLSQSQARELSAMRQEHEAALEPARQALANAVAALNHTGSSEEETSAIERQQDEVENRNREVNRLSADRRRLEGELASARRGMDEALGRLEKARFDQKRERDEQERIRGLLYPEGGSLLAHLREQDAGWARTIGRVINPDLLSRKDLSPALDESVGDTCYGWSLNLESLTLPECARGEEDLRLQHDEASKRVAEAGGRVTDAEADAGRAREALALVETHRADLDASSASANDRAQAARNVLLDLQSQAREARRQRLAEAKKESKHRESVLAKLRSEAKQAEKDLEDRYRDAKVEAGGVWEQSISSLKQAKDRLHTQVSETEHAHKKTLKGIDEAFSRECLERGVDAATIEKAENEMIAAQKTYQAVSGYAVRVEAYERWLKNEWSSRGRLEKELAEAQENEARLLRQKSDLQRGYNDLLQDMSRQIRKLMTVKTRLSESADRCKRTVKDIACEAVENNDYPSDQAIESLFEDADMALQHQRELSDALADGLQELNRILSEGSNAEIAQAWKRRLDELFGAIGQKEGRARALAEAQLVEPFLKEDVPSYENTLITALGVVSDRVIDFYDALKVIDKSITNQASQITRSIEQHLYRGTGGDEGRQSRIEAIRDVRIDLQSQVTALGYWKSLDDFKAAWARHMSTTDVIPDDVVLDRLSESLSALTDARVTDDIQSLFELSITMTENDRPTVIRNDTDLYNASSHGLSYIAMMVIFIGITRHLCPDRRVKLHWPVDELETIAPENIAILFGLLDDASIVMVGGFPNSNPDTLRHFAHRHHLKLTQGVKMMDISVNRWSSRARARSPVQEAQAEGGGA